MRGRGGGVLRLAVPAKVLAQRFAFPLLFAAAVALLVVGKADIALMERGRTAVIDALGPVLSVLSRPVEAGRAVAAEIRGLIYLRTENARLREDNARLLRWQEAARRLEQDNAVYRRLLRMTGDLPASFISARVVGDTGGAFVRTMLLSAGARDGVDSGQAVIGEAGVIGRVVEVGEHASRILLLTDLNSRIPVVVESSRYRAILAGDNTDQPRLEFLPVSAQVSPGDRLVTSGHGGLFPPGLPVGVVTSVGERAIRVQPFANWHRLDVVSVVRYEQPTLPDRSRRFGGPR